jgi:septum formation protein
MKKIILASISPRRKMLLDILGFPFTVDPSEFIEKIDADTKPHDIVYSFSQEKAKNIAHKYNDAIIIAADTVVALGKIAFGKPNSHQHAVEMLQQLSGKTHVVLTGYTVLDSATAKMVTQVESTAVTMKDLTLAEIEGYIAIEKPFDKAGAWAIQGIGSVFVKEIKGDYYNVLGLPLSALYETLKEFGVSSLVA